MQQEAAEQQQVLESWQRWAADGPGLDEAGELDPERQVSAMLRQALNKGQKLLEQQQQRWVGGLHSKWGGVGSSGPRDLASHLRALDTIHPHALYRLLLLKDANFLL